MGRTQRVPRGPAAEGGVGHLAPESGRGPVSRPAMAVDERNQGDALWDTLRDCHQRMRAELRQVVLAHGIYLSEFRALARLRDGPRTLTQLAESLGLTPGSMTDLANQLVSRGWASRQPNPQDRRSQLLTATATGLRVHTAARREYRNRLAEVYSAISPRTRTTLAVGLEELRTILFERSELPAAARSARRAR
jgi:DNA-binding MarR family transcriptional regulator